MMRLPVLLGALALIGCVSTLTVTKTSEKPAAQGIRYSLPTTMLVMKPDPAGKTDYSVELLSVPDIRHEYAIHAETFLGKYDLDVILKDGLLEQIQFAPDDTAVAGQVFDTAAGLAAKEAELEAAAEKDARTKQHALEQAIVDAELALEQARLDAEALEKIWKESTGEATAVARAAFLKGQAEVAKKEAALAAAKTALAEFETTNSGLLAKPATPVGGKTGGPMLFEIVDTVDPAKCVSATACPGKIEIKALTWKEATTPDQKQQALDVFAKPKASAAKQLPTQLSGPLVYAASDPSFWHVRVNFAGDLPPNGRMTQLIWIPYRDADSPSPVAPGCSPQFNQLPAGAVKEVTTDLGPKVSVDAVGSQARFSFPRACFPPGFYKMRAEFPLGNALTAGVDTTAHLCEEHDCARPPL